MGATINNDSLTKELPPLNGQLPKPLGRGGGGGLKCTFVQDPVVVKAQQLFSWHGKTDCFCYRYPDSSMSENRFFNTEH